MNEDERRFSYRQHFLPLLVIVIACLITRLPFRSRTLYHWDSVQFALALHHFDVSLHQPHPPGYILYVAIGKVFNVFIHDDNTALVSVSIIFTIFSSILLFLLLHYFVERNMAFLAALFYISSPLVWFHGEVAFSYIVEGFFSTLVAYHCLLFLRKNENRHLILATFSLSFSGGVRQNTMILLAPLWFYAMFTGLTADKNKNAAKLTKSVILQTAFLAAMTASWFIPMILFSGGYKEYSRALHSQWSSIVYPSTIFGRGIKALFYNGAYLLEFFFLSFTAGFFLLCCYMYYVLRNKKLNSQDAKFLLAWIMPSFFFYLLLHINNPGYIFTFLPALMLVLAKSFAWLKARAPKFIFSAAAFSFIAANAFVFLISPVQMSWTEILHHDANLSVMVSTVRENFAPDKTIILSFNHFYYGFRHAMVYLPEYTSYEVAPEAAYDGAARKFLGGGEYRFKHFDKISIPPRIKYVIIFSDPRLGYPFVEQTLKKNKLLHKNLHEHFSLTRTQLPVNFLLYFYSRR